MVRHIVMWKVKESDHKEADIQKLKRSLEGLKYKITEIKEMEVGIDFSQKGETSADIVLHSTFTSNKDLLVYQKHPEHIKVVQTLRSLTTEKRVTDYNF